MRIALTVNGEDRSADVRGAESLLTVLREELALLGSKNACEHGECGSCSVVLDGDLVCACLVMAADADGSTVRTVEGYASGEALHPVQQALLDPGGSSAASAPPASWWLPPSCSTRTPRRRPTCCARSWRATSAAAPGYGAILRGLEELAARNAADAGGGPAA